MRFEDEQYIRLYKRDTTTWLMLNWQGRCILPLIFRKLDRAGLLDLGEDGYDALAAHIQVPIEVVEEGMKSILKRKALALQENGLLVAPRFIEAQEAKQSDKARQKASRDRARDLASAAERGVTIRDAAVTDCDRDSLPVPESSRTTAPEAPSSAPIPDSPASKSTVTPCDSDDTERDATVTPRDDTVTRGHTTSQGVTLSSAQLSSAQLRERERAPEAEPTRSTRVLRPDEPLTEQRRNDFDALTQSVPARDIEPEWQNFVDDRIARSILFGSAGAVDADWRKWVRRQNVIEAKDRVRTRDRGGTSTVDPPRRATRDLTGYRP